MKKFFLYLTVMLISITGFSQVSINTDSSDPDASSMLDIKSTTKGILISRMTSAQRVLIESPVNGLLVYQTDGRNGFYYYNGTNWVTLADISGPIDFDGNAYPTIVIGNQQWMAKNLTVMHYRNGDEIPNVTDESSWSNSSSGAYCWYNNDPTASNKYGILYNWHAVNDSRGLCPTGWHVPTNAEWTTLANVLGGTSFAGGQLKSISALWVGPNTDATNSYGFSGLPGGVRLTDGTFLILNYAGYIWSSSDESPADAWGKSLGYSNPTFGTSTFEKTNGLSVRCIKD